MSNLPSFTASGRDEVVPVTSVKVGDELMFQGRQCTVVWTGPGTFDQVWALNLVNRRDHSEERQPFNVKDTVVRLIPGGGLVD